MTENPYDEMDALDEQVINAMYEGAPVDSLVYDVIDYYTKGEMLCDKDGCSIERPHRHLRSVNIACIYEIINRMKCVMAEITEEKQTLVGDAWYWKVKVVAFDALNVRKGLGAVLEKIGQHPPTSYKMAIAKAKRNAYRELIPQTPLYTLAAIAKEGRTTLTAEDVTATFGMIFKEREYMLNKHFERLLQMNAQHILSAGGEAPPPPRLLGSGSSASINPQQSMPTEKDDGLGDYDPSSPPPNKQRDPLLLSDKQVKMIYALLKGENSKLVGEFIKTFTDWKEFQEVVGRMKSTPPNYSDFENFRQQKEIQAKDTPIDQSLEPILLEDAIAWIKSAQTQIIAGQRYENAKKRVLVNDIPALVKAKDDLKKERGWA